MKPNNQMDMSQAATNQMVASVAALPDADRKTMMNKALHALSDQNLEKILKTRLELLYEMSQMMREKALMSIEANKAIPMRVHEKDMMREAGLKNLKNLSHESNGSSIK